MQGAIPNIHERNTDARGLGPLRTLNEPNTISQTHPDILGLTEAMFEDEISTIDNGHGNLPQNSVASSITSIMNEEEGYQYSHFPQLRDIKITDEHLLNESLYNKVLATKLISNRMWILDYITVKVGNISNFYKLENVINTLQKELLDPDLTTITDTHQFMQYKPCLAIKLPKEIEWVIIKSGNEERILSILLML